MRCSPLSRPMFLSRGGSNSLSYNATRRIDDLKPGIDFPGRFIIQRLMNSTQVVKIEVFSQSGLSLRDGLVAFEINVLVFDRTPQALNEDIVQRPTAAIHADRNSLLDENPCKLHAGKLATLVGIKNFRSPVAHRLFETLHAKIRRERIADSPGQNISTVPINNRRQIHKPVADFYISDVHTPDLIHPVDDNTPQQIGINLMIPIAPARIPRREYRHQAHQPHKSTHPLATNRISVFTQFSRDLAHPIEGALSKLPVDSL